jgi:hypothetical protein
MQIVRSQQNIAEKVFKDSQGRLIRARFAVYEAGGRIKARLLDWELIETLVAPLMALFGKLSIAKAVATSHIRKAFVSPYFNTEILNFTGTKARAPTF